MRYTNDFGSPIYTISNVLDGISLEYNGANASSGTATGLYPTGAPGSLGWGWTLKHPWRFFASLSAVGNTTAAPTSGTSIQFNDGLGSFDIWNWTSGVYIAVFSNNYNALSAIPGGGWTLTLQDQTQLFFNSSGQLLSMVDSNGNQINYTYSSGLLSSAVDQQGRGFYFTSYGSGSQPTAIYSKTPGTGKLLQLSYTGYATHGFGTLNYLSGVTISVNPGTSLQYAMTYVQVYTSGTIDVNLLQSVQEPQASKPAGTNPNPTYKVDFNYRSNGTVNQELQDYVPASTSPSYPSSVQKTVVYLYGPSSLTIYEQDGILGLDGVTYSVRNSTRNFDVNRNLVSETDPLDNCRTLAYNGYLLESIVDANFNLTSMTYDTNSGNPLTVTDAQNNTTTYLYSTDPNLANLVVAVIQPTIVVGGVPTNYVTRLFYDLNRNLRQIQDPLGNTTFLQVNAQAPLLTATIGNFTQPLVNGVVPVALGSTVGLAPGQSVYIATGGFYTVVAVTATTVYLQNIGSIGNAAAGTATINSGSVVVNTTQIPSMSTLVSFTQPAAGSLVFVSFLANPGLVPGQFIYIASGGAYSVVSALGNSAYLINLGFTGNASPTSTVTAGSAVVKTPPFVSTSTTLDFLQPLVNSTVTALFTIVSGITAGQTLFIVGGGLYSVVSVNPDIRSATLLNLGLSGSASPGTDIAVALAVGATTSVNTTVGSGGFTPPAINSTVTVPFASVAGMTPGQFLYIATAGFYCVVSVGSSTAVILNLGTAGNATSGTIASGSAVVSTPTTLNTTTTGFTPPAVNATVPVTFATTSGMAVGQAVYVAGGGIYTISSITSGTQAVLLNLGCTGNATTSISSGAAVVGTFTPPPIVNTTATSFTQPAVNSSTPVTLGFTGGMTPGQLVYVVGGGFYSVSSVTNSTQAYLTNLGYAGNIIAGNPVSGAVCGTRTTTNGWVTSIQDANGNKSQITYTTSDANTNGGNVQSVTVPGPTGPLTTSVCYGPYDDSICAVDPSGNTVWRQWDQLHRPMQVQDPLGNIAQWVFPYRLLTQMIGPSNAASASGTLINTTITSSFTQPAVNATTSSPVPLASVTGIVQGQLLKIAGGGYYTVSSISGSSVYLTNIGYAGNAASGTTVSGPTVSSQNTRSLFFGYDLADRMVQTLQQTDTTGLVNALARVNYAFSGFSTLTSMARPLAGSLYLSFYDLTDRTVQTQYNSQIAFSTTASSFSQPSVGGSTTVTFGTTTGMAPGQVINIVNGGFYSVNSVTNSTQAVITNLGYASNPSSGFTIPNNSPVAMPVFNTTTTNTFTQPAVFSTATATVSTTNGLAPGQWVYLNGGGLYFVESVTDAHNVVLVNPGSAGNASPTTPISSPTALVNSPINGSTNGSFTQPAVGDFVTITLTTTPGTNQMVGGIGQLLYIVGGGFYKINHINSSTVVKLRNLGYAGNAVPGATIANGAAITNPVLPLPLISSARANETNTVYSKSCFLNTVNTATGILRTTRLDNICRLTQIATQAEEKLFVYDTLSRVVSATSGSLWAANGQPLPNAAQWGTAQYQQTRNFIWDAGSRLNSIQQPNGLFQVYARDKVGNLTQQIDIAGNSTFYRRFPNYQLKEVTYSNPSESPQTFSYAYSTGRLKSVTYPAPVVANTAFDKAGRLTFLQYLNTSTSANIQSFLYGFDNSSNRTSIVDQTGTSAAVTWGFGYDWFSRLSTVSQNGSSYSSYGFDGNDNRISYTLASTGTTIGYNHNVADQLQSTTTATSSSVANLEAFVWDQDGRMSNRTLVATSQVTAMTWTTMNKLGMFTVNGVVQESDGYSADGLRNTRTDGTRYYNSGGVSITDSRPTGSVSFIQADQLRGIDPGGTGAPFYYLTDHLGSVRATVNSAGTIQTTSNFSEYGLITATTAPGSYTDKSLAYVGALGVRNEPNTPSNQAPGLMLMGQRFYDGNLGQFLNRDPIGFRGGLNLFGYAAGNPIRSVDPSGLAPGSGWWNPTRSDCECPEKEEKEPFFPFTPFPNAAPWIKFGVPIDWKKLILKGEMTLESGGGYLLFSLLGGDWVIDKLSEPLPPIFRPENLLSLEIVPMLDAAEGMSVTPTRLYSPEYPFGEREIPPLPFDEMVRLDKQYHQQLIQQGDCP